jgi:23S rRNA pseudouridine1911/1915/1917 synthase
VTGDRRFTDVVEAEGAGARLDQWLARRLPELSRMRVQALIAAGRALVDGRAVKAAHRVQAGEQVEVAIPPPARDGLEP